MPMYSDRTKHPSPNFTVQQKSLTNDPKTLGYIVRLSYLPHVATPVLDL